MTKITWKGEDELHHDERGGPSFTTWMGIKFPKGTAVEISDERMIKKARGNQYFEVEDDELEDNEPPEPPEPPEREPEAPRQRGRFTKRKGHGEQDAT